MKTWHLFFLLFLCTELQAQDFTYHFNIKNVSFAGSDYINIVDDSSWVNYTAPQWQKDSTPFPVAYVSGKKMEVSAQLELACANAPDSVLVRAFGDKGLNFPIRKSACTGISGNYIILYPQTPCDRMFDSGVVSVIDKLHLGWQVSLDGIKWFSADSSVHQIYITLKKPMANTLTFNYYRTVMDLSCRNALGASSDTAIVRLCWSEFTDKVTLNYKGDSLFYYKTFNTPHTSVAALLRYKDAECFSFAQLFLAMLKIQGVVSTNNYVEFYIRPFGAFCDSSKKSSMGTINTFMVKNWKFGKKSDTSFCPNYGYRNTCDPYTYSKTGKYVWRTADMEDSTGLGGQCNPNPASLFRKHQVAKIGGIYYDASYGVTYSSVSDFQVKSIDGWGVYGTTSYNMTNDLSVGEVLEYFTTW